ncbi:hypothetical protein BMI79_17290 [Serratia oryzae]|uniref:Uncharacterized protein n=2 Tax=Serratia oryzae TaxID=2034155 RepID=A0A1S8CG30_9GAMM|nr:hypothetical protein BMI79_17290 [Serratia oryzae]
MFFSTSTLALDKVTLSDLRIENTSNGLQAIVGEGRNTTNNVLKNVFVRFNLYQGNTAIGETIDIASNIAPGESWRLQAIINSFKGRPDGYKITDIQVQD